MSDETVLIPEENTKERFFTLLGNLLARLPAPSLSLPEENMEERLIAQLAKLADIDNQVRFEAIQSLQLFEIDLLREKSELIMPILVNSLGDTDELVRLTAANLLLLLKCPPVESIITCLGKLLHSDHQFIVSIAAEYIEQTIDRIIDSKASHYIDRTIDHAELLLPSLINAIMNDRSFLESGKLRYERGRIRRTIVKIGKQASPYLLAVLQNSSAQCRQLAAEMLESITGLPESVVPALTVALGDSHAGVRIHVSRIFGNVRYCPESAIPAMIGALQDIEPEVRTGLVLSLGRIGIAFDTIVPALIPFLQDKNKAVRREVRDAIREFGRNKDDLPLLVPLLLKARQHPTATKKIRKRVVKLLFKVAPESLAFSYPVGLERMGDEAGKIRPSLEIFYHVGLICKEKKLEGFAFSKLPLMLSKRLGRDASLSDTHLRNCITRVSKFFHTYFEKFEGLHIPNDDDACEDPQNKFIARSNGSRLQIIGHYGWRAWEETKKYFDKTDKVDA